MPPLLSFRRYLYEHSEDFRVVSFYERFDFESRATAETVLSQTVNSVINKGTKHERLRRLCARLSANNFEILRCRRVEVYWIQMEAEQIIELTIMTQVKCNALAKLAEARKTVAKHEKTSQ